MSFIKSIILFSITVILSICSGIQAYALTWQSNSVLSSGKWVKVKVTETGIQEISYDQLRELGFSNPEQVTVFGYGGTLLNHNSFNTTDPDDLPQIPVIHNNNRILFYGVSHERAEFAKLSKVTISRNHYALSGFYFITDSQQPAEVTKIPFVTSSNGYVNSHASVSYINPLDFNPMNGGVYFFSKNIVSNPEVGHLTFPTPDREPATNVSLNGMLLTENRPSFSITANETKITTPKLLGDGFFSTELPANFIPSEAIDGKEIVDLTIAPTGSASYLGYEYIAFSYTRLNYLRELPELQMIFNKVAKDARIRIYENPSNIIVWNVTNPSAIGQYELIEETGGEESTSNAILTLDIRCSVSVPSTHQQLVAFRPEREQHHPKIEGEIMNQDLHSLETPDLLIITTDECFDQAERLAELHRFYQNFTVQVVRQQDIYNEFSSGTPTPMAYRRLAKMFYDRDPEKFKYLLLFGSSTYDNRLILEKNQTYTPDRMLLSYQVEEIAYQFSDDTCFTTDSYFGMLDDYSTGNILSTTEKTGYHKMLVSVGRIPADYAWQAKIYVDKAEKYLKNGISTKAQTRTLLFADDGDSDIHLISAETMAEKMNSIAPYNTITRAHNGIYRWKSNYAEDARRQMVKTRKEGIGCVFYSGHASTSQMGTERFWDRGLANETEYNQYPFIFFAACNVFGIDRHENGICDNELLAENGGTIALAAPARSVFNDENLALGLCIISHLYSAGPHDTFGDIFRKARNDNFYQRSYTTGRANTHSYNFGGDPALPSFRPGLKVNLLSVNGVEASEQDLWLTPMQKNSLNAQITDAEGNLCNDYNGFVTILLYESPRKVPNLYPSYIPAAQRKFPEVTIEDDLLVSANLPVVNGVVNGDIIIPTASRTNEATRMVFAAENPASHKLHAVGVANNIKIRDFDPENAMETPAPPQISAIYLNTPDFIDGDITSSSPVFHAEVSTEKTALSLNSFSMAPSIKLLLDHSVQLTGTVHSVASTAENNLIIDMPLSNLTEGMHSLTLFVNDIFGNTVSETINFQVVDSNAEIALKVELLPEQNEVSIDADHTFTNEFNSRLIIQDIAGNHIRTINNVNFPYSWDTTDSDGNAVPDGTYIIKVLSNDGVNFCGSEPLRFILIR